MRRTGVWSCVGAMALVWAGARFSILLGQQPGCLAPTLNPTQAYVPYVGANLSFTATTASYNSCGLSVTSGATWITVLGFTNNSPSTVNLQVSSGTILARSGAVTVASGSANANFVVQQSGSVQISSPTSLSNGAVGVSYGPVTFAASNGVGGYSWSASGLPSGLTFSSSGVLSGTPGSQGSSNPIFTVTDAAGTTASATLSLTIGNSAPSLSITSPSSLSAGTVGTAYGPVTFAASGGTSGYTWAATSGLPSGMSFSAGGVLTGTPATGSQGAYSLNVTVKDSSNTTAKAIFALTINPSGGSSNLFVSCPPLGTLTVGVAVSGNCSVFGGTQPYTLSISAGALPAGLSLNSATGTIGGTPTTAGPYSFTVQATDSGSPKQTATGAPESGSANLPGVSNIVVVHAADGNNFKTTFILTDTSTSPAPYTLKFDDESGNTPGTPVPLASGSLQGMIGAGSDVTIGTAGTGSFVGWAELSALNSVGGSVIYSQQAPNAPTRQEGTTILNSSGSQHFFVPFDNTQGAITAMAVTNPGGNAANIAVTLRYSDGTVETPSLAPLASRSHQSFALPAQFPNSSGRSGVAEFVSTSPLFSNPPLYAVVFRFNPTGAFTALDVVQPSTSSASITRTLSHAGDGNGFKTTVLLTNTGTQSASYSLQFDDGQGNAPSPPIGLELGTLTGTIPGGGSATIRTAGTGSFIGWAELTAPASVGGSVIYSQPFLKTIQEGTATIVSAGTQHFFLPFDNTNGAVTAMALTNSGASTANLTVTVRYSDGTSETPSFPALASRNHQSFTIPDQFPNSANRTGVVEFVSSSPLYPVAFRFNPTGAFTAFGIVSQ